MPNPNQRSIRMNAFLKNTLTKSSRVNSNQTGNIKHRNYYSRMVHTKRRQNDNSHRNILVQRESRNIAKYLSQRETNKRPDQIIRK